MSHFAYPRARLALGLGLILAAAPALEAQFFGGGGFGGGTTGRRSGSSSSTRTYYNSGEIGEATITSDPETRRLIVITDEETNLHISQVITNLDRPKPQVLIKVVFLEVTHNKGSDIGIQGQYTHVNSGNTTNDISSIFGLNAIPLDFGGAGFYKILSDDFQVIARAIASAGKTEVLSRPSIMARNNQEAVITVGQEIPYITDTRITDNGQTINTVQYQDIGIILRVTPFITSDGLVEMIVAPEISTLSDKTVPISETVDAFVIAKRSAETVVVTPNGHPIIIGGLMENHQTESVRKIPLLGDIPLLGLAFRRTEKANTKTELIIILTPHIVNQPTEVAALTNRERQQAQLVPQAFSEQELDRFIDALPVKAADPNELIDVPPSTRKKSSSRPQPAAGSRGARMTP
ncbi:MAG TPA: hypothetical protein P5555_10970 [Candidatus Paceibacterota bacterium]|nr:hypothetical protein [Verrucomicrobiota bacterium]HRZ45700.1 hypothetical protein [Candidatus Paceibacterota bacterium]